MFGSIAGRVALAGLCSEYCRTAGLGWLVFGSFAGRVDLAGLCSVVLQCGWLVFGSIAGRLA